LETGGKFENANNEYLFSWAAQNHVLSIALRVTAQIF
jgi:hypothetical protein